MTLREQIMLAGRAHPAGIAAVAEFAIREAAIMVKNGKIADTHSFGPLATAIKNYNLNPRDLERLINGGTDKGTTDAIKEIKRELFAQIRDAVMGVRAGNDFYLLSPIFKHFDEHHIMKLDYNEGDRVFTKDAAHAGSFQRPERILTTRKPILGQIYRLQTAHSADSISAGAVTEALANDLTRIAGVPAQELEIVRGEYSDGHPKLMLQAKFADGYKDMEAGFTLLPTQRHLRQGRCASVLHQLPGQTPPSTRPQGLGVGPRPLCGSCCVNPKVPASLISRWFWVPQSVLVSLSLSGTPTQAPGLVDFLSLSLSVIPLVRRPCASRKNLESN